MWYVTSPLVWTTLGLDVHLWLALCLLAVLCHVQGWAAPTALAAALALLMHPETGGLIAILLADWIAGGRPFRPSATATFGVLVGSGWMGMIAVYGSIGPVAGASAPITPADAIGESALSGLAALAEALAEESPLWLMFPLLAIMGLLEVRHHRWALLLVGWAALHVLTLALLRAVVYVWDFFPLIPALGSLGTLGISWAAARIKTEGPSWALAGLLALIALAPPADSLVNLASKREGEHSALQPTLANSDSQQAGVWLNENLPPDAWVGVIGPTGLLGYEAHRLLRDFQAQLQPADPSITLAPNDVFSWLAHYRPDAAVLFEDEVRRLGHADLINDPWFEVTYAEATHFTPIEGPSTPILIYQRTVDPLPMIDILSGMVVIAPDLILNRIATDFSLDPLEGGRRGLVRLEWLSGPLMDGVQHVAIRIRGRDGSVMGLGGRDLDFSGWPPRRLVTSYHWIDLSPVPAPGAYHVEVGLGSDPFNLTWHTVATAKVPFESGVFVGGFSGVRAVFGDIALSGYRINRTEGGLEVLLLWQAIRPPLVDYRILIQVRDAAGNVTLQRESEPHEGAYPTSVWSSGEQVPDTIRIDTAGLPPGSYEVYVGVVAPDGVRLRTEEGQENVPVGHVSLDEP